MTAYDMRSSDLSSDVCSSDLNVAEIVDLRRRPHIEAVFRRDFAGEEAAVRTILADAFAVDARRRRLELRLLGPIARQVEVEPSEAGGQAIVDPQIDARSGDRPLIGEQRDLARRIAPAVQRAVERIEIGRAHVCTPVTNAHLVCRLLLE